MEIVINDEKIDFTLENEESLGEVVTALETWLAGSNLIITSLKIQNRELIEESEKDWTGIPLEDIGSLFVTAKLLKEIQLANMETLLTFLDLMKEGIEKGDEKIIEDLLTGSSDMITSLRKLFRSSIETIKGEEIVDLENLLAGSTARDILSWPEGVQNRALHVIQSVESSVRDRLEEIKNPSTALSTAAEDLKRITSSIGGVSVLLQTGQEQTAMDHIVEFSDLSQRLLRILTNIEEAGVVSLKNLRIGEKSVRAFFADLNGILRELIDAFHAQDSILIGDLLEYEVVPRLELFSQFIVEFRSMDSSDQ